MGFCLGSYNEFCPLGLRDKLGCGPYSKSHMPRKCSFHSVKSNRGQAKFGAKQVCATRAARRVAVARHVVLPRGSAVGFVGGRARSNARFGSVARSNARFGNVARSNARFGSVARSNARLKRKSAKDRGSSRACAAGRGPRARLRCAAAGLGRASRGRGAAAASENWARRAACGATRAPPTGPPRAGGWVRLSRAAQNEYSNLRGVGARRAPPPIPPYGKAGTGWLPFGRSRLLASWLRSWGVVVRCVRGGPFTAPTPRKIEYSFWAPPPR